MIITDYNKMSIEELQTINKNLGIGFVIEDGAIVATE